MVFSKGSLSSQVTENSPLLPHIDQGQENIIPLSSKRKTFGNIVISVVGAGVLGLPYTFKRTGWLSGSVALIIVGYACFYCMMLLVSSRKRLEREGKVAIGTLSDLGFHTCGQTGRFLVDSLVVLSQASFCIGYLIFIAKTITSVLSAFHHSSPERSPGVASDGGHLLYSIFGLEWGSNATNVWLLFPLQVGLAAIRSLTHLAPFSIFADIANGLAMVVVMKDDIFHINSAVNHVTACTDLSSISFVIGVAMYAFEGIPLVLPLEAAMKEKAKFPKVLGLALSWIAALYIAFGLLGYLAFGDDTKDIVTLNLGGSWETVIIQLALCVGLLFTYPVMMHPVHEVVERRFTPGRPFLAIRSLIILFTVILAASVPGFSDFMSLVGSSACSILIFILPASFHLRAFKGELSPLEKGVDCFLVTFGVIFGIWGTISSILSMTP